jgi:pseudouridine-5'-phosphate glycosidase/pseudouridine kinase
MHIPGNVAASTGFARQRSNIAKRCVVAQGRNKDIVVLRHFPALKADSPTNVTGAGDSFVGTLIAGIASDGNQIYDPQGLENIVNTAQQAAVLTLQSHEAVSPLLSTMKKL